CRGASLRAAGFSLAIARRPPSAPLFPYTTLFRSFVEEQHLGVGDQRRGQRDPLRLATGQLAGAPRAQVRGADLGEYGVDPRTHRSEEHTSELQSRENLVCRLLLEKKKIPSTTCGR